MHYSAQHEFRQAAKDVRAVGKQAAFAQVVALTRTALDVQAAEKQEMRSAFDRPTPYTLNSIFVRPATKAKPEALVGVKDDENGVVGSSAIVPALYLGPEIDGGSRHVKRFERRLQLDGAMPRGWFAVPGKFARLDEYGNLSRGQITQILSQLTLTKVSGYTANISARSRKGAIKRAGGQFLALPKGRGKLIPGIYQVRDTAFGRSAPRPVVIFVPAVHYRPRFHFDQVGRQAAEYFYDANLKTALDQYATGIAQ